MKIKKVLVCKPLHYDSIDYVINPWMHTGKVDKQKALTQWNTLISVYKSLGITVAIINQKKGNPDMVFATDQGIVHKNSVLLSRFWCSERKNESVYYERWFKENLYTITYLPENVFFEGNGDSYQWRDTLLIGTGYRADQKTCDTVGKLLNLTVVPLELVDPLFYHLDVGFLPLNDTTAFYYPPAFSKKSREVLKKLVPNLREFSKDEAYGFCANSIVTDTHVIHQKGNPTFQKKLKELGYMSIAVDVSEFIKSGGGIHCLTNILEQKEN